MSYCEINTHKNGWHFPVAMLILFQLILTNYLFLLRLIQQTAFFKGEGRNGGNWISLLKTQKPYHGKGLSSSSDFSNRKQIFVKEGERVKSQEKETNV